jgi:dTDP-4-dehydrorhamnose reductase
MRPVLVTGANGFLGQYLVNSIAREGYPVVATGKGPSKLQHTLGTSKPDIIYRELDFTNPASVMTLLEEVQPIALIHAGAMTQVDDCELDPASCHRVNVTGTKHLLEASKGHSGSTGHDLHFLFLSTDFIFDGESGPYKEEDPSYPLSVYGHSKWTGERLVMASGLPWTIIRTVLVYGKPVSGNRSNIITWVKTNLEKGTPIKVVSDQWRTPTYVEDLARGIVQALRLSATGVFHMSGKDFLTPYDMAVQTARLLDLDTSLLTRVDASTFTQPGRRPARTGFIIDKAMRELSYAPVSFEQGIALTLGLTTFF